MSIAAEGAARAIDWWEKDWRTRLAEQGDLSVTPAAKAFLDAVAPAIRTFIAATEATPATAAFFVASMAVELLGSASASGHHMEGPEDVCPGCYEKYIGAMAISFVSAFQRSHATVTSVAPADRPLH